MSDSTKAPLTSLAQALGRIPSGLFILTARHAGHSTGMLASWVQQAGFVPPMVTVAINKDRYLAEWVEASRRFTLNQVRTGNKALIRHFGRGFSPDLPAFDNLELLDEQTAQGGPVLKDSVAWLDLEVQGRIESGDHWIVVGLVVGGGLLEPAAEPLVHVRGNGMRY